jgi:hypothetical protein
MDDQEAEPQECPFKRRKVDDADSCDKNQTDTITENIEPLSDEIGHDLLQEEEADSGNFHINKDESEGE